MSIKRKLLMDSRFVEDRRSGRYRRSPIVRPLSTEYVQWDQKLQWAGRL